MSMPSGDSPGDGAAVLPLPPGPQQTDHRTQTWHVDWMSLAWLWGFVIVLVVVLLRGSGSTARPGSARASARSTAWAATRPRRPGPPRSSSCSPASSSCSRRDGRRSPHLGAGVLMAAAAALPFVVVFDLQRGARSRRRSGRRLRRRCRRSRATSRSTPAASASTSSCGRSPRGACRPLLHDLGHDGPARGVPGAGLHLRAHARRRGRRPRAERAS